MSANAYIARQPIVDAEHRLIAYELLFRHSAHAQRAHVESDVDAGIAVISNTLFNMGTEWLLKGKLAFVNMEAPMLMSSFSTLLPKDNVVIEVLETVRVTPEVLERLHELKEAGYSFALDDFNYLPESESLLPLASYVKLDVQAHSPQDLARMVHAIRHYPVKLVAEKVETPEQFRHCRSLGFDYFQGYYFARPENIVTRVINPTHATVLQLMEKVRTDANLSELENLFKKDVALTFKLLRYINSAGFGLSCEVQSIRHAVSILGMQPLYRWLSLLLVTAGSGPTAPTLARTAITRGRLCELLGKEDLPRNDQDNLFIVGVFSLLPALLEITMEQLLERVVIPDSFADALLQRSGLYGPFLALVEAVESGELARLEELSTSLMLTPAHVNEAHMRALAWVEQLGID
ncbi:MAG: EAL domain-containing protein [Pseudomonadota bacterium]|nr:EAL domain-containing protein [Pseudomonadota bacterium]MDP1572690.1 EAL domain-containing protein [Pseudomonadota bacterium]MDP1906562.1 EAL domain-containing protein [Pseudomonadota bacterium]